MPRTSCYGHVLVVGLGIFMLAGQGVASGASPKVTKQEKGGNLLENPGFEQYFDNWEVLFGNIGISQGQNGSLGALFLVDTVSGQNYWAQLAQVEQSIIAGDPVYASGYIKTAFPPVATATAGLMVQFLDANDNVIGQSVNSGTIGGQTDWRYLDLVSSAAPWGTVKARLSIFLWAAQDDQASLTGNMYADNFTLVEEVRPLLTGKILRNKGFENGLHEWTDEFGYPVFLSTDIVHSGTYAAGKQVKSIPGVDYYSHIYQTLTKPLFTSSNPKFSGYIKTDFLPCTPKVGNCSGVAGLSVEFLDENGTVLEERKAEVFGQTDWTQYTVDLIPTPAGTNGYRLNAFIYGPQGSPDVDRNAYYDDMTLK